MQMGCLADKEDESIVSENGKKSKQMDRTRGNPSAHHSQDTEQSQDMPSSELTQKCMLNLCQA